jgi:hypothetical protein
MIPRWRPDHKPRGIVAAASAGHYALDRGRPIERAVVAGMVWSGCASGLLGNAGAAWVSRGKNPITRRRYLGVRLSIPATLASSVIGFCKPLPSASA